MEKTEMFLVRDFDNPIKVNVIKRDGKVFLFAYAEEDDDYCKPYGENLMFFDTEEEATKYHSDMISEIDIEKCKNYIEYLYRNNKKELETILPDVIYDNYKRGYDNSFFFSYQDKAILQNALKGILNIDAVSFRISDISQVKYGEKWLTVVLKNGEEVTPRKEIEVFVIKSIFGENNSGRTFCQLNKPADKD